MSTVTYKIPNISCGHCVHSIKMELGELAGVKSVDASAETKMVTIQFEDPATEEEIIKVLNEINYPPQLN
jgi:copper chaperone